MEKCGYYYYSGLESFHSTPMVMRTTFYEQAKYQIRGSSHFSLSASGNSSRYFKAIGKYLVHCLLSHNQVFLPYVGHFSLKNNRLVFSASRLFKDRVKGIAPKEHRQNRGRIYGGEELPGQTTPFWVHHKDEDRHLLSKRRQFVIEYIEHLDMSPIPSSQWWYPDKEVWKNYSLGNICFQAYVDALFFRVINGKRVRIDDVGILYAKNNRLYFRTSSSFRNIQKKKNEGKDAH